MEKAEKGIAAMLQNVDALIVIPNQNLLTISAAKGQKLTMRQSYQQADEVLKTDVIAIAEIITKHDDINVDFADITTIIKNAGYAHMAIGQGQGKDKVNDVVKQVIESELLGTSVTGAKRLLVDITMSEDIGVDEMAELTDAITNAVDPDAEIIFGNGYDSNLNDAVSVTVIAADFDGNGNAEPSAPAAAASPASSADPKADAEAMHRAGVKAADNPSYYDDIFNVLKRN
jgi:cell division protein FtsZ